jgi:hypothetical protein
MVFDMLKTVFLQQGRVLTIVLWVAGAALAVHAQTAPRSDITAHWHCSKHPAQPEFDLATAIPGQEANDLFDLTPTQTGTVGVSLPDLMDAYSGRPVQMGSQQLTACFMVGQTALNQSAQERVGMQWPALQQQQRRSSVRSSHVRMVHSEAEMLHCIANHYPAVGYLSQPTNTSSVGPCF